MCCTKQRDKTGTGGNRLATRLAALAYSAISVAVLSFFYAGEPPHKKNACGYPESMVSTSIFKLVLFKHPLK